jgi:Spy/CpxP family protein refolding chaperone
MVQRRLRQLSGPTGPLGSVAGRLKAGRNGAGRWPQPKEDPMSEIERDEFGPEPIEKQRARRRVFWLGVTAAGLAAALVSVIAIGGSSEANAMRGWFGHRGHGHGPHDAEAAREHAGLAAEWLLRSVDASDAQQARVGEILDASFATLAPLAERHRAHHAELIELLGQPTIDRAALERVRAEELALAEAASRALTASLADVAETLSAEQRAELIELAQRFHH